MSALLSFFCSDNSLQFVRDCYRIPKIAVIVVEVRDQMFKTFMMLSRCVIETFDGFDVAEVRDWMLDSCCIVKVRD